MGEEAGGVCSGRSGAGLVAILDRGLAGACVSAAGSSVEELQGSGLVDVKRSEMGISPDRESESGDGKLFMVILVSPTERASAWMDEGF